ncbi:MAG: class I SAM-dependent methyltransferase [Candidatus Brocadiia bacterium]
MATTSEPAAPPGRCPCCEAQDGFAHVESVGRYSLWLCADCDVVFSQPMRAVTADEYDDLYVVRQRGVDARMRPHFRWALRQLPERGAVLDVGCETGFFVHCCRRRGLEAYGLDISPAAVRAGRRRFSTDALYVGSSEQLPDELAGRRFAAVTAFEVLEHQSDPASFLHYLIALLEPDGQLLLSVPNRDRWPVREFMDYPPHHLLRWSPDALGAFLRRHGLTVEQLKTTSRFESLNHFYGYFARKLAYRALNMDVKGLRRQEPAVRSAAGRLLRRLPPGWAISALRRVRDAGMWVPALASWPVLGHRIQGYHLVAEARRNP